MKTKILKLGLMISLLLFPLIGHAYDIEVNGIYYDVNVVKKTVAVTSGNKYYKGDVIIPSSINYLNKELQVTSIGDNAFRSCSGLTSVTIPNSLTEIGYDAFYGCSGLTGNLNLPNSLTSIGGGAFYGCSGLTGNLNLPNSLTSIGGDAFYGCSGLTGNLNLPNSLTSIGEWTFYNCRGLTSVTIPNSVTSIGKQAFYGCRGLKSVILGSSVTEIGKEAFAYCYSLKKCAYPKTLLSPFPDVLTVSYPAADSFIEDGIVWGNDKKTIYFVSCDFKGRFEIPNSVTSIEHWAFCWCSGLTSVTIPNSVTYIGIDAFFGCSGLTGVEIPYSVTYIEPGAFDSTNLKTVTVRALVPPKASSRTFDTSTFISATLYVPEETINVYKETAPWSYFFTIKANDESSVKEIGREDLYDVFNLNGQIMMRQASQEDIKVLEPGIYIINGKKMVVK